WLPEDEGHDAALLLFPALFFHSSSPPFGLLRRNHRGRYLAHFPYKKLFFLTSSVVVVTVSFR
nr:hypothetical protein [Candidatus Sigynarchaeota archaeon]